MATIWSNAPAKSWYRCSAPAGAPEPPEDLPSLVCGECANLWSQDGGCSGVCKVALGRFFDEVNADRWDKWALVNETIDWVLCNIRADVDEGCKDFEEA